MTSTEVSTQQVTTTAGTLTTMPDVALRSLSQSVEPKGNNHNIIIILSLCGISILNRKKTYSRTPLQYQLWCSVKTGTVVGF